MLPYNHNLKTTGNTLNIDQKMIGGFWVVLYLIEEKSSACGSSESRGDQFRSVGQDGVTVGTRKETRSTNVVQKDASHR